MNISIAEYGQVSTLRGLCQEPVLPGLCQEPALPGLCQEPALPGLCQEPCFCRVSLAFVGSYYALFHYASVTNVAKERGGGATLGRRNLEGEEALNFHYV